MKVVLHSPDHDPLDVGPMDAIRVSHPGQGGRSVDVELLAAVISDDIGWQQLKELMAQAADFPRYTFEGYAMRRVAPASSTPALAGVVLRTMASEIERLAGGSTTLPIGGVLAIIRDYADAAAKSAKP